MPGYRRNLPHLRLAGATYFVTFRLSDSIPDSVAARWREEDEAWQARVGTSSEEQLHFERARQRRFFVELDKCHGSCLLAETGSLVASALEHFDGRRIWLGDYVVMPNHVHLLVQPFPGIELEEWLYSVKRFSSNQIITNVGHRAKAGMRNGHLWQTESFDRVVRTVEELS